MQILIATGGSAHSDIALQFGASLMQSSNNQPRATVLMIIRQPTEQPQAEAVLAQACRPLGQTATPKIRVGHPAEEIIRETEEHPYNLVIVGERQHHGLVSRFLLGSTAERVVEHAACPVVIARGKVNSLRQILLCDSGANSHTLLNRFLTQLAPLFQAEVEITVLHVMSQISAGPGIAGQQLRAVAQQLIAEQTPEGELLQRDMNALAQQNIAARPKIRHGFVVDEILAETQSGNYDLVVIGAHQGQGWRHVLLDDLARKIIQKVDRPILVVR